MKPSPEQSVVSATASREGPAGLDRRRLIEGVAAAAALAGAGAWSSAAAAQTRGGAPADSRLADGSEFPRWEQPLNFSRTYHVDNGSPLADDAGPGSRERPFRTIGRAAELLQPGERVVIATGVYRECVRPARGGTGPGQMISYEAAPGAKVHIRGSEVLKDGWRQETVMPPGPSGSQAGPGVTVWRHDLTTALFPDNYNPFALPSIMGSWGWLDTRIVDMGPYLRRRGLVFVDGQPLEPMEQLRELALPRLPGRPDFTVPPAPQNGMPPRRRGGAIMQEVGGSPNARFWTETSGTAVYVRLQSGTPADHLIEVTTRQNAFIPLRTGTSYIRVKGLTFQHVGNAYPFPQNGMVSLAGGDHWILEDNTLEWANGMALEIGGGPNSAGARSPGTAQIIRGNTFRYCGVEGVGGMGTTDCLIEDNLIEWCGWADAERGWEAAGAKFHRARNMLFRRNVIRHMRHANAAWWDVDNVNCRITQNVFADCLTVGAALHIEMTPGQSASHPRILNAIDNNIIWDVRNAEPGTPGQRGCAGSGIFNNATDNLLIAHNLIGRCDNAGIFAIVRPDRGGGVGRGGEVANNIFAACGRAAVVFLNTDNKADGNLYVDMPAEFLGLFEGAPSPTYDPDAWRKIRYRDLAGWQALGWDRTSAMSDARIVFDPDRLELTLAGRAPPRVAPVAWSAADLRGVRAGAARPPGPLASTGGGRPVAVDPRAEAVTAAASLAYSLARAPGRPIV